jgi:HPt (histidine-containing phosphotransfer) domain-containing protein
MGAKRYNLSYLNEISGGDKDFILDMIQTFVNNSPSEIADLEHYANSQEWDKLGEYSHKFAPGLQFIGIVSLRPVINQIEEFSFKRKNLDKIPELLLRLKTECLAVCEELRKDFKI